MPLACPSLGRILNLTPDNTPVVILKVASSSVFHVHVHVPIVKTENAFS
jgi:hypothetical protein